MLYLFYFKISIIENFRQFQRNGFLPLTPLIKLKKNKNPKVKKMWLYLDFIHTLYLIPNCY